MSKSEMLDMFWFNVEEEIQRLRASLSFKMYSAHLEVQRHTFHHYKEKHICDWSHGTLENFYDDFPLHTIPSNGKYRN